MQHLCFLLCTARHKILSASMGFMLGALDAIWAPLISPMSWLPPASICISLHGAFSDCWPPPWCQDHKTPYNGNNTSAYLIAVVWGLNELTCFRTVPNTVCYLLVFHVVNSGVFTHKPSEPFLSPCCNIFGSVSFHMLTRSSLKFYLLWSNRLKI